MTSDSAIDRLPIAAWARVWPISLAASLLVIASWEFFWRSNGYRGQPNDDVGLWAVARTEASRSSERVVVFAGSSRTQLSISRSAFNEVSDRTPIQLAIGGYSSLPVLRNLAEDSSFRGLVVCELIERDIAGITQEKPQRVPEEWIREYNSSNAFTEFEWRLQILSQESFAFRLPGLARGEEPG